MITPLLINGLSSSRDAYTTCPPDYHIPSELIMSRSGIIANDEYFTSNNSCSHHRSLTEVTNNRHVICIPKVSNKITKQYIFSIFCSLKVGFIEKLSEVPIKNDPLHKRIFVKIKWNHSNLSKYIYTRFESGENVKVVYSDPWYWICVSNTSHTRPL